MDPDNSVMGIPSDKTLTNLPSDVRKPSEASSEQLDVYYLQQRN